MGVRIGMSKRVYMVAGELSGDAHGAWLLRALKQKVAAVEIRGVGGPHMVEVAGPGVCDWLDRAAVMGVCEVLKNYRWFRQRFYAMLAELQEFRPDVLVLVDYPGFNLRFAKAVKKVAPETRIVQYVCPQVWAWNKRRIPMMARILDEVLCLFPFEQMLFQNKNLKTTFVGHPLVDELESERMKEITRDERLVGLFPGSREREVASLFPMMMETVRELDRMKPGLSFEVPAATVVLEGEIRRLLEEAGMADRVRVTKGGSHGLMQRAGCAVIASGTATLEAAYYGLPYCLVYRVAPLTYVMAKLLVKIRRIGIVNILAEKDVVREYVQEEAREENVSRELMRLLDSEDAREAMRREMAEAVALLGGPGAHDRAADAVARWLTGMRF
jgi:lipid-A-disaccharide synthase